MMMELENHFFTIQENDKEIQEKGISQRKYIISFLHINSVK